MPYTPTTEAAPFAPAANGITSQAETYNIYSRPIAERTALFARHNNYVGFSTFLKAMGFSRGSDTPTVGHYELPWQQDTITIGAITTASTGVGTPVTFELDASNMYNTGVTSGGTSVQASYPLEGDVFELYDNTQVRIKTKDVSVSPHRITVDPLDNTIDLATRLLVTEEYGIQFNLFAESTGLPPSRAPRIMKYTNEFGLIKHACRVTGHELTNAVYHETIPGDASSARQSIYQTMKVEDVNRYERSKSNLLLFGKIATGLTELVTATNIDTPITSTEGLVPFGLTSGFVDTYTVGAYAITDFDVIANKYYDERSISNGNLLTLDGPTISTETENVLNSFFSNDLTPFINNIIPDYSMALDGYQEGLDEGDNTVGLGYSVIRKNGLTFHMKRLSEFNDIKGVGSTNYKYRNYRVTVPVGFTTDVRTSTSRPMCGYEFKQLGNYSREDVVGDIAGAGVGGSNTPYGKAVNEIDNYSQFMISHIAGHWAVGNAIVMQIPA